MQNWLNHIKITLKDELTWLLMISIAAFLFILFFQPFPVELDDFNNRLLFVTGFGVITFVLGGIILVLLPSAMPGQFKTKEWEDGPPFMLGFIYFALSSTAFTFYIRYVGNAHLSFFIVFKVVLVSAFSLSALIVLYKNRTLQREVNTLQDSNKYYLTKVVELGSTGEKEEIEIFADGKTGVLKLKSAQIVFIKSAENYIEIYYREEDKISKKLIRSTLKKMEAQLASRKQFIRCHRTCIVNSKHIEKLQRSYSGYSLKLYSHEEMIPVSRQYLILVKDSLSPEG